VGHSHRRLKSHTYFQRTARGRGLFGSYSPMRRHVENKTVDGGRRALAYFLSSSGGGGQEENLGALAVSNKEGKRSELGRANAVCTLTRRVGGVER